MTTSTLDRRRHRMMTPRVDNRLDIAALHAAVASARHQADEHARQIESAWDQAFFG